jgi:hypothetical protein
MAYHLFCNDTIIVQVGYITIERKQEARIGNNTFLFVHRDLQLSSQVEKKTLCPIRTASFISIVLYFYWGI